MNRIEEQAVTRAFDVLSKRDKPPTKTLQLAYIELMRGGGAEAAMEWIVSYLEDNGLVPGLELSAEEFFEAGSKVLGVSKA